MSQVSTVELARLIAYSAYTAYTATLVGNRAPSVTDLYERMRAPQVGDLVLETSTYYREPWDPGALGRLVRVAMEPMFTEEPDPEEQERPLEKAWYVAPFVPTEDGRTEVRWHNADFIAIPDRLRWIGGRGA